MQIENFHGGVIPVQKGNSPRIPYEHQQDAMTALSKIDKKGAFKAMIVLPTGGGKTLTAALWLLGNAINQGKKVIWVAHRHLLLDQARCAFENNAYGDRLPSISNFRFRVVSGQHDKSIHISKEDDLLVIGKDSLCRKLSCLDDFLAEEQEVFLVIDEAHHATALSYRKIVDYIETKDVTLKMIGLTATPFRTSQKEEGLLGKIFTDDIIFKIDLATLIKRGILSTPEPEVQKTNLLLGEKLVGSKNLNSIYNFDKLPENIENFIAQHKDRNFLIADTYLKHHEKYGQTLVFALNVIHAHTLKAVFTDMAKQRGVDLKVGVIVSTTRTMVTNIDVSKEENEKNIAEYRKGTIQVLINVNILTEGADLPQTQTVFLARPTVSQVLMTQMIGRALRGESAGGTKKAYIVSFVDDWNDRVSWISPDTILEGESDFCETTYEQREHEIRLISIQLLEEFARIVNDSVDTTLLERVPFEKRIPLGMYFFSYTTEGTDVNCQILVYHDSKDKYDTFLQDLPSLFQEMDLTQEELTEQQLEELLEIAHNTYFYGTIFPTYHENDTINLLKFFAMYRCSPPFKTMEETERKKLNLTALAEEVLDKGIHGRELKKYLYDLWEDEENLLRHFYQKRDTFISLYRKEEDKLLDLFEEEEEVREIIYDKRELQDLSLYALKEHCPELEQTLRNRVFLQATTATGDFLCSCCNCVSPRKWFFEVDHILPMSKGGKTIPENLQLLCRNCNRRKSDH